MTAFYNNLKATALRLLTDKGLACTLRKKTAGAYNTATGSATGTTTDYSIVGVLLNYNRLDSNQKNDTDTMVKFDDRKAIIQSDIAPDLDDDFIFNGTTYRIISIKTTNPADIAIIYELQVRV